MSEALSNPLRLLLLEDSVLDAELTLSVLAEGGFDCDTQRVEREAEFRSRLEEDCPDLILADFSLPAFDGVSALEIAQALCPQVPFIFVSGALGEELAIETLKRGATDYVLKHRLERLIPSVRRALREAEDRVARVRLEEQLRRRAAELAEADQRKDEFIAMLAHELRNPLAPIFNALHLMGLEGLAPEQMARSRDLVERQARHMARLLDDLLDISRIARGKILLRLERQDLTRLVADTVEDHRRALEEAGLALHRELPGSPLWLNGDATRLAQVVGNLLQNAAKFTPAGGQVFIRLAAAPDQSTATLTVRDTGIGVAPDALSQLFEPFTQEGRSTRQNGGLGLGLALVRGLVALHGGTVRAASPGPNQGAEFTCELPLAGAQSAAAAGSPETEHAAPAPAALRVLVIDDNHDAADTLVELLCMYGHEVDVAYNGITGLEAARRSAPQVVLCDLGLPGMDGFQVAAELRRSVTTASARIIAVSGYGQPDDRRRSQEAGFDLHLTKPVDPACLTRILESYSANPPAN
ncbi:MAG: response regulator [Actinomycetota bacterium]